MTPSEPTVVVLCHQKSQNPDPKNPWPLQQVIAPLNQQGFKILFAAPQGFCSHQDQLKVTGMEFKENRWCQRHIISPVALYNRFPERLYPLPFQRAVDLADQYNIPIANPPNLVHLLRDKWRCSKFFKEAGIQSPEVITLERNFIKTLREWKTAFLKPRFGALGRGVIQVDWQTDRALIEGIQNQQTKDFHLKLSTKRENDGEWLLQHSIEPIRKDCFVCFRSLVQRDQQGTPVSAGCVARVGQKVVVSVASGAKAKPGGQYLKEFFGNKKARQIIEKIIRTDSILFKALEKKLASKATQIAEIGADYLIDSQGALWLLEVNGVPQGRLQAVSKINDRWASDYHKALMRPFLYLYTQFGHQ